MDGRNTVVTKDPEGGWRVFQDPTHILVAEHPSEVARCLDAAEAAAAGGLGVAGFVAYEAASGLDQAFRTHSPAPGVPLVWFGVYDSWKEFPSLPVPHEGYHTGAWESSVSASAYDEAVGIARRHIASGDTYQVNYTIRLNAPFSGSPYALFLNLHRAQGASYSAFVDIGERAFCSASPELFFRLDGDQITSRPMKGTAPRGVTLDDDDSLSRALQASGKNRAENVMIVDMVRNDLGRIAEVGSVKVPNFFVVERYPTVHQMTSSVEARTSAGFSDLWRALFPAASITGAPKVRTMEIIRDLEGSPRGIYTGAIGCLLPSRRALFNVAIRTVDVNRPAGSAEFGVGGGIVWDSVASMEHEECVTKALVLTSPIPDFDLLETIRWTAAEGFYLLDRHLSRVEDSARYFGFTLSRDRIVSQLTEHAATLDATDHRVRLLLGREGAIRIESSPISPSPLPARLRVGLARDAVSSRNLWLYHKTTRRDVYQHARASRPDCDDVILFNERGEVTESCIANVVIESGGRRITPPIRCGLLAGVFRAHLLELGEIEEGIITPDDLATADAVHLANSVRCWIPVEYVGC